jgi:hypothetical protein
VKSVKHFQHVEKTSAECNEYSYLAILHLSRVELHCKLQEKLQRVTWPLESKIIYLLYIFYKLIVLYLKVFKFHLFFAGLYKKFKKHLSCCHDKHDV